MSLAVQHFFDDKGTSTLTYVLYCKDSAQAVVFDPVLALDTVAWSISKAPLEPVIDFLKEQKLKLKFIIETHVHADHLTGATELKNLFPQAQTVMNHNISMVQHTFSELLGLEDFKSDGSQFDLLVKDNDELDFSDHKIKVIEAPGHTPACTCFLIEKHLFTGDVIFMPDFGTGRCDFPGGDAKALHHSIVTRLYTLDDDTKVYVGHDYQPGGRELEYCTTISEQKQSNIHLTADTTENQFVEFRTTRDAQLSNPKLLYQSLQYNMNGGTLPQTGFMVFPIKER